MMTQDEAKQQAEALRYRLQVRLGMIARVAQAQGNRAALESSKMLRDQLRAIALKDSEWVDPQALRAMTAIEPRIRVLQEQVGVEEYGKPAIPKWARALFGMFPMLALLMFMLVFFERRRRTIELDASELAGLDSATDRPA